MQPVGAPARSSPPPAAQGRDGVQRRGHQRAVVAVGAGRNEAERRASVTRWRLVPALTRSVGYGPVADPPFSPVRSHCRRLPGSRRSRPPHAGVQAAPDAGAATRRRLASRAAGASSSCRSRTSSRPAASPRGCSSAEQTGCPSRRPTVHTGTPALRARRVWRQKRGDHSPEIVREKRASHTNPTPNRTDRAVLLGALNLVPRSALVDCLAQSAGESRHRSWTRSAAARMEIPQTGAPSITAVSAFSLIRLGFKELGQSLPVPSFRDAQLDGASSPLSVPVTVIRGSSPGQAAVLDQLLRALTRSSPLRSVQ